jgi:hypothetical protein
LEVKKDILILLREDSVTEDIKVSKSKRKQHVIRMPPYRYLREASFHKLYWYMKLGTLPKQVEGTVAASEEVIMVNFCLQEEEEEEEEEMLNFVWRIMENRYLEERVRDGIMSLRWMLGNRVVRSVGGWRRLRIVSSGNGISGV